MVVAVKTTSRHKVPLSHALFPFWLVTHAPDHRYLVLSRGEKKWGRIRPCHRNGKLIEGSEEISIKLSDLSSHLKIDVDMDDQSRRQAKMLGYYQRVTRRRKKGAPPIIYEVRLVYSSIS